MDKSSLITFILGGSRSGKTAFALNTARQEKGEKLYLATSPVLDEEMAERIRLHREERKDLGFDTIEEELSLDIAIKNADQYRVVLLDCITLWISNLLFAEKNDFNHFSDKRMRELSENLLDACRKHGGHIVIVSNETGLGIVPDNPLSRKFKDLSGTANQTIAAGSDRVFFMTAGIPVKVK